MEKNWNDILRIAEARWTTNQTFSDSDIKIMGAHIIATPTYGEEPQFTMTQLYDMFRLGYDLRKQVGLARRSLKRKATERGDATYNKIRYLEPGEKLSISIENYGAARSAASQLKKTFGTLFTVKKVSSTEIIVTRLPESSQ